MSARDIITKIEAAGFHLATDGSDIIVTPPGRLSEQQRAYLKAHKTDILNALRSTGTLLEAGQGGHDIEPANDDARVLIHVPELALSTGQRISCDMTVPRANLERLRAVVRFTLKDNGGGGSLLGSPGTTEAELREVLAEKYPDRLATVDGAEGRS